MSDDREAIEAVVTAIKQSKKYRDTSEATIRELAAEALNQYKKPKQAEKAVRKRLHSIMAPYLGDPDYEEAAGQLAAAFATGDEDQIRAACWDIMHSHLSTRERLPILDDFYRAIFQVTGRPQSILDIACGLNPLALPWMGLSVNSEQLTVNSERSTVNRELLQYYAFDIHELRIEFINRYFALAGLPPLARVQDVALRFPEESGDVALFLKEMPRFERNYGGLGRPLLEAIRARWLVVSFPTVSTHGGRNLTNRYREFMFELVEGKPWPTTELLFEGELVFILDKGDVKRDA
ncbi:MAG TPA: hypothetical protein VF177_04140 [Anaerolineae bacterium]